MAIKVDPSAGNVNVSGGSLSVTDAIITSGSVDILGGSVAVSEMPAFSGSFSVTDAIITSGSVDITGGSVAISEVPIIRDFFDEVARGNIAGASVWASKGEREAMGTPVNGADIWRGNELTPAPTSTEVIPTPASLGEAMSFVSENAADTASGTGVLEVTFDCLDASGNPLQIVKATDGLTACDLGTNVSFINDMYSSKVGTNGVAAGNIKVGNAVDMGLIYNMIYVGGNKSLVPHRKVPLNKTLVVKGWHCEETQNKRINFRIRSTDMYNVLIPGVFCFKDVAYLKLSPSGWLPLDIPIPSLSIIKVSGWPDQTAAEGSCGFRGILYDN